MVWNKDNIAAVIILAGDPPAGLAADLMQELAQKQPRPLIIAADGGARALWQQGIKPDMILGDGDSLESDIFPDIVRKKYPPAKDFTDGEAAFAYAFLHCAGDIAVLGALGGRIDQEMANILLPLCYGDSAERFWIVGEDCLASYCLGDAVINGHPGDILSRVPRTPWVKGIDLTGLAYPLHNYDLAMGSTICTSNVLTEKSCRIIFRQGKALIVHYPLKPADES